MKLFYKSLGLVATNAYLICDEISNQCIVIDAPQGSFEYYNQIITDNDFNLVGIWLTHTHWDHTWDLNLIKDKYNVDILVHSADIHRLDFPNDYLSFDLGFKFDKMKYDKFLTHNQKLTCGELEFDVIHTPGHTEGGVCFVNHKDKTVIAGDTIFNQSIGRTDLPGGNYNQLINSIKEHLLSLPDDYGVYCGHGEPTNIGDERLYNQFLV
jgi:glyoxylase-like metal-dependent hydrolase (beta-lactamase superfamily II)